ncbi:hypothetical protein RQP46_007852 [Phenoliferia psychrophenolica]
MEIIADLGPTLDRINDDRLLNQQPAAEPTPPQTPAAIRADSVAMALRGRLFLHECTISTIPAELTIDSGSEVEAMELEFFQTHGDDLGLTLVRSKNPTGVSMANNTSHLVHGTTTCTIDINGARQQVKFQVIDSGGAFTILLGKRWLAQTAAIMFCEIDCLFIKHNDDWKQLWNQNVKVSSRDISPFPTDPLGLVAYLVNGDIRTELPHDPIQAAQDLNERFVRKSLMRMNQAEIDPKRPAVPLSQVQLDDATRRVLLLQGSSDSDTDRFESWARDDADVSWAPDIQLLPKDGVSRSPITPYLSPELLSPRSANEADVNRSGWSFSTTATTGSVRTTSPALSFAQSGPRAAAPPTPPTPIWSPPPPTDSLFRQGDALSSLEFMAALSGVAPSPAIPPNSNPTQLPPSPFNIAIGDIIPKDIIQLMMADPTTATSFDDVRSLPSSLTPTPADTDRILLTRSLADEEAEFIASFDLPTTPATTLLVNERWKKLQHRRDRPIDLTEAKDSEFDRGTTVGERRDRLRRILEIGEDENISADQREAIIEACLARHEVFAFSVGDVRQTDTIEHSIPTDPSAKPTHPRFAKSLSASQKEFFHETIQKLIAADVHLNDFPDEQAKKPLWRLCHAFMDLNDATLGKGFPIGDLEAKISRLAGKEFYSAFDMHSGYFAIRIREEDIPKTAFAVEDLGIFAYNVMPFGLTKSPSTFCNLVAVAFGEHLAKIKLILDICREHKLSLNPAKCHLAVKGIVWCGSYLSSKGREPDKAKVQTVLEWPTPKTPYEVLRFMNFAGYYRPLIKGYARMSEPLQRLTRDLRIKESLQKADGKLSKGAWKTALKKQQVSWEWGADQILSFKSIKEALTSFPVMRSPDFTKTFIIETDASILGFGASVSQDFTYLHPETGKPIIARHPIAYVSRSTSPSEKWYSAFLLELVCVKWALEKFRTYVFGQPIELITDCIALAGALKNQKVAPAHASLDILTRYKDDSYFGPISQFVVALQTPKEYGRAEAGRLRRLCEQFFIKDGSLFKEQGTGPGRECIPESERLALLREAHTDHIHSGRNLLLAKLAPDFYWPNMVSSIEATIQTCPTCQQFGRRSVRGKLNPITVLELMQLLSMDYLTLPDSKSDNGGKEGGFKSVLLVIDFFTRHIWGYKFTGEGTGKKTVSALSSLFKTFGAPHTIMSDGGGHLDCKEVNQFLARLGVQRVITPPYAPYTNGHIEGANKLLIRALTRMLLDDSSTPDGTNFSRWPGRFDDCIDSLNDRIVSTTGFSSKDLLFTYKWRKTRATKRPTAPSPSARNLELFQLLSEALSQQVDRRTEASLIQLIAESRQEAALNRSVAQQELRRQAFNRRLERNPIGRSERGRSFTRGDLVLIHSSWQGSALHHKLQREWTGPYRIVCAGSADPYRPVPSDGRPVTTDVTFFCDDPLSGKAASTRAFHVNRLKHYHKAPDLPLPPLRPMPDLAPYFEDVLALRRNTGLPQAQTRSDEEEDDEEEILIDSAIAWGEEDADDPEDAAVPGPVSDRTRSQALLLLRTPEARTKLKFTAPARNPPLSCRQREESSGSSDADLAAKAASLSVSAPTATTGVEDLIAEGQDTDMAPTDTPSDSGPGSAEAAAARARTDASLYDDILTDEEERRLEGEEEEMDYGEEEPDVPEDPEVKFTPGSPTSARSPTPVADAHADVMAQDSPASPGPPPLAAPSSPRPPTSGDANNEADTKPLIEEGSHGLDLLHQLARPNSERFMTAVAGMTPHFIRAPGGRVINSPIPTDLKPFARTGEEGKESLPLQLGLFASTFSDWPRAVDNVTAMIPGARVSGVHLLERDLESPIPLKSTESCLLDIDVGTSRQSCIGDNGNWEWSLSEAAETLMPQVLRRLDSERHAMRSYDAAALSHAFIESLGVEMVDGVARPRSDTALGRLDSAIALLAMMGTTKRLVYDDRRGSFIALSMSDNVRALSAPDDPTFACDTHRLVLRKIINLFNGEMKEHTNLTKKSKRDLEQWEAILRNAGTELWQSARSLKDTCLKRLDYYKDLLAALHRPLPPNAPPYEGGIEQARTTARGKVERCEQYIEACNILQANAVAFWDWDLNWIYTNLHDDINAILEHKPPRLPPNVAERDIAAAIAAHIPPSSNPDGPTYRPLVAMDANWGNLALEDEKCVEALWKQSTAPTDSRIRSQVLRLLPRHPDAVPARDAELSHAFYTTSVDELIASLRRLEVAPTRPPAPPADLGWTTFLTTQDHSIEVAEAKALARAEIAARENALNSIIAAKAKEKADLEAKRAKRQKEVADTEAELLRKFHAERAAHLAEQDAIREKDAKELDEVEGAFRKAMIEQAYLQARKHVLIDDAAAASAPAPKHARLDSEPHLEDAAQTVSAPTDRLHARPSAVPIRPAPPLAPPGQKVAPPPYSAKQDPPRSRDAAVAPPIVRRPSYTPAERETRVSDFKSRQLHSQLRARLGPPPTTASPSPAPQDDFGSGDGEDPAFPYPDDDLTPSTFQPEARARSTFPNEWCWKTYYSRWADPLTLPREAFEDDASYHAHYHVYDKFYREPDPEKRARTSFPTDEAWRQYYAKWKNPNTFPREAFDSESAWKQHHAPLNRAYNAENRRLLWAANPPKPKGNEYPVFIRAAVPPAPGSASLHQWDVLGRGPARLPGPNMATYSGSHYRPAAPPGLVPTNNNDVSSRLSRDLLSRLSEQKGDRMDVDDEPDAPSSHGSP